jgi:Phosphoglucomutase/phosphomannomutase, alpha/beta/alpha domain I
MIMTCVGICRSLLQLVGSCTCHYDQVGRDPRLSGPALAAALAAGLASKGVAVTDFGPATTPAMFMSCILEGAHKAVSRGRSGCGCSQLISMQIVHRTAGQPAIAGCPVRTKSQS